MVSPVTKALIKIFVKGFYKDHAGLVVFFLVTVFSYLFFIEALNQTHLAPGEVIYYNLMIVLTLVSSPAMVAFVFSIWFLLTLKSWRYVHDQLLMTSNQFLFYSITAASKTSQFKTWLAVQLALSIPMFFYASFCLVVGVIFGHYFAVIILFLYLLILAALSARVYMRLMNDRTSKPKTKSFQIFIKDWNKPFFSFYIFFLFDKLRVPLAVTKGLSLLTIIGSLKLADDVDQKSQVLNMTGLAIAIVHTFLIFYSYQFVATFLRFTRNLPITRKSFYLSSAFTYLLLTLPETIWLVTISPTVASAIAFNLVTAFLFRNLLYTIRGDVRKYIYLVFAIFAECFLAILYKQVVIALALNFVISVLVFNVMYYRQSRLYN